VRSKRGAGTLRIPGAGVVTLEEKELGVLADEIRDACLEAAMRAWEDAGLRGICRDGRWELAVDAMRRVDLRSVVDERAPAPSDVPGDGSG
jgi:hypothetical protein